MSWFNKSKIQSNADQASREAQEIFSNVLLWLPDPDVILKAQNAGSFTYKDLLNDPHVSAVFQKRKSGVQNMEYELQNENCAPEIMQLFDSYLKSIDLYALIDNILNCVFYGYQPFVLQWDYANGYYTPRVEDRPQQYFYYDTHNQLCIRSTNFRVQPHGVASLSAAAGGFLADPLAFSIARNKPTYSNPYGEKLASKIFWSVTFKKGGMKFWLKMTEKYGMPFLFGKTPKATTQEKREDFLDMLSSMVQDGVAVINKEDAVEMVEAAGKGDSSNLYQSLINHCNQEITKAFLTVSNTTEQRDVGSFAAARVQQDGEKAVNQADAHIVERFMNELIGKIATINFASRSLSGAERPKFILFEKKTSIPSLQSVMKFLPVWVSSSPRSTTNQNTISQKVSLPSNETRQ